MNYELKRVFFEAEGRAGKSPITRYHPNGFTLIEGIVTGVLMAILAGVLVMVWNVHEQGIKEGTARTKMMMQYATVYDEIGRQVRRGHSLFPADSGSYASLAIDSGGTIIAKYKVSGDDSLLYDSIGFTTWAPIVIGGDSVKVWTTPESSFTIKDSVFVALRFGLLDIQAGDTFRLQVMGGAFRCRN